MVYNWDGKEADCRRLYVEEKKSLDEVIGYWEQRGFTPSKRAFQTQFKRWGFPSKQNPAHKNPALVNRVQKLWEKNVTQRDMLETLHNEGFQINDRELMRVRLRFEWLLRESTGKGFKRKEERDGGAGEKAQNKKMRKVVPHNGLINQLGNAILQECSSSSEDKSENGIETDEPIPAIQEQEPPEPEAPLDPEILRRRQERLQQLQAESDERWRTRKRRRRTRGWAGLPADAPGEPPRFPSETTLDESKAYLSLNNNLYRQVREQFQAICKEQGVVKKTVTGPEKWGEIKDRLVRENVHLSNVFQGDPEARQQNGEMSTPSNFKALSLDVICMDVTKRLRNIENRMGILEAKNALGLNPEETRQVRSAFYAKLKADRFTNKFEAGNEHWNELKQSWIAESDLLTNILRPDASDANHAEMKKAVEVLARDVMKRLRNENSKKDSSPKKQVKKGPGPGPAPPSVVPHTSNAHLQNREHSSSSNAAQTNHDLPPLSNPPDLQIDPSLLLAASDPSVIPQPSHSHTHNHSQSQPHHNPYMLTSNYYTNGPLPIFFRLHPNSSTTMPNKTVWLGILQAGTVGEIRNLAMREHPGTVVVKIEGLVVHKMQGHPDREIMFTIDDEDELAAYLSHVADGKATCVVSLGVAQGGGYVVGR
ncbi:hypothetical protein K469DRAFT_701738 [Zopfia rhizophila CBS 207.26]|uniref:Uncharacterized protein n=1 Tax=Zopfia rhizophila CBS 207.26 TaxID=1314779 RepID=A0A6A6EBM0_9PEZI|nr:hypothetical protein K469DRAFT_701738 [Zopfia rhizophila CBS 207.26]